MRKFWKCSFISILMISVLLFHKNASFAMPGDINGDIEVDLTDAILTLQIFVESTGNLSFDANEADIDQNAMVHRIDLEESIYALQVVSGLRHPLITWYKDADGDRISDGTKLVSVNRPSLDYYEETELYGLSGDPDDNNPNLSGSLPPELTVIQSYIGKKDADWIAESNPISQLSENERQHRLGTILPDLAQRSTLPKFRSKKQSRSTLPNFFDWRSNSGNYVTPVKDQGGCMSCWAFAATAALESQRLIHNNNTLDLSEQIVVSCSDGTCEGGSISRVSSFLRDIGTGTEVCYPYNSTDGNCLNACVDWQSQAYSIDSWSYVSWGETPTVLDIKNALYENGPLLSAFLVYEDFFSYESGVYSYAWGKYEGGHAILIVGWDDAESCFIIKNWSVKSSLAIS